MLLGRRPCKPHGGVFLAKDPADTHNPLAYRILKITSGVYRKWASLRMKHLQDWIQLWDEEAILAGVPGKGATDGWYKTALILEQARANNLLFAGGSVDIYKCFDQLNRQLVYALAKQAGMPERVLQAYSRYLEGLQVQFQVGNTIGRLHHDRASLPQGCPFSMTMVALLTKPWVSIMKQAQVSPRCLADDLMIIATGHNHQARYINAMQQSKQFFTDIGARIADNKCFSFAGDSKTRDFLAAYVWDETGLKIPTVNNFRDIGSHLNLTSANNGKTLTDRMVKTTKMVHRLRWMPLPIPFKEKIVKANILPAALYGVEAVWANKAILKSLRAAIANTLGPRSARASNHIVFNNTTCSSDLDPNVYILTQRVQGLRRILAKYPHLQGDVRKTINCYQEAANHHATLDLPLGPVGLLLHSLRQVGANLTPDFKVTKLKEADISIIDLPWQHLKKAISDLAVHHRATLAEEDRSHLTNLDEVDNQIVKKIIGSLGPKEVKVYNHVSTGAAWSEAHLEEIGYSDGKCKHCGGGMKDITHICWDCPEISKHRKVHDLKDVNPDLLPDFIKHGVPKAMSPDIEGAFWGGVPTTDHYHGNEVTLKSIGMPACNKRKVIASCKNQEIKDACKEHDIDFTTCNARQCFQQIKACKQPPHMVLPYKCYRPAPVDINVYTDGSWVNPLQQYLGLGGAGVWWPGRNIAECHFISQAEDALAYSQQYPTGLMLYTPIGGFAGSSTRTELAAAIVAICANGPVHIGTDSQAFLDRAVWILKHLRNKTKHKTNWRTTPDGDLWQHFELAAGEKGWKSFRITKVQGHATDHQVAQGNVRACDKIGNDQADKAADIAVQTHGEGVVSVARILHQRHGKYTKFMQQVARHIVEGYLIHKKLTDLIAKPPDHKANKVNYQPLQHQTKHNSCNLVHKIVLQGSIARYGKFNKRCKAGNSVWNFLSNLEIAETTNQHHATTWLEMYIIYRALGYPKPLPDNPSKSRSRATACMQLREFTKTVRGIVQRGFEDGNHISLFKPMKVTHERFLNLGVKGRYPAINGSIIMDDDLRGALEQNIIALGHRISTKAIKQFREGNSQLTPNIPNLKGRVGWDARIIQVPGTKAICCAPPEAKSLQVGTKRPLEPACFHCPKCNASELSTNKSFQLEDLDATCKCKSCKQQIKVKDWWCGCCIKWHACTIHQSYANASRPKIDPSSAHRAPKRSVGPFTYEQLLEVDAKRRRRETPRVLPPTANLLSPNLRIRFAHLLQ